VPGAAMRFLGGEDCGANRREIAWGRAPFGFPLDFARGFGKIRASSAPDSSSLMPELPKHHCSENNCLVLRRTAGAWTFVMCGSGPWTVWGLGRFEPWRIQRGQSPRVVFAGFTQTEGSKELSPPGRDK